MSFAAAVAARGKRPRARSRARKRPLPPATGRRSGHGRHGVRADLSRLDGRVQMNVKVSYEEEAVLGEIVAGEPEIARLRRATAAAGDAAYYDNIRLGELVAAALAARRAQDAERLFAHL